MKIIQIKYKNIHNLKGDGTIDFSQEPLRTAGLFAITGPTGSGKSTLLDIITLALFNRMPRFSKAISSGEIKNLGSILTHHTKSAEASIIYEVRGKRFTSTWSIRHKRTGNLGDYHMELYDGDGTLFDLKRSEVAAKNEAIIGLKYDQFVKSIILAQGEFSKFLKANKNERGELLENITGTTIYRRIGQLAFERHREIQANLEQQKAVVDAITILSTEDRATIQATIEAAEKEKTTLNKTIEALDDVIKTKVELEQTKKALTEKAASQRALAAEIKAFEPQRKKLDLQEKLAPLLGDIRLYEKAEKEVAQHKKNKQASQVAVEKATNELERVLAHMTALTQQTVTAENFRDVMSAFEKEVTQLDHELNTLKTKGQEQRQRINAQLTDTPLALSPKIKPDDALTSLRRKQQAVEQVLHASNIDTTANINDIKATLKSNRNLYDILKEVHHAIEHVNEISQQVKHEKEKLVGYKTNLATTEALLTKTQTIDKQEKEKLILLQKQKEDALTIASLTDRRAQLQDGDPCPLCGSTTHPYSIHTPTHTTDAIDEQMQKTNRRLKEITHELNALHGRVSGEQASIKHTTTDIEKRQKTLQEWQEKKNVAESKIPADVIIDEKDLAARIHILRHDTEKTEAGIEAFEQQKIIAQLTLEFTALKNTLETHQSTKKRRSEKTEIKDVSGTCNDLQDQFIKWRTDIQTTTNDIQKAEALQTESEAAMKTIAGALLPQLAKVEITSIHDAASLIIDANMRQHIQQQHDTLMRRTTALDTEITTLRKRESELATADSQADHSRSTLESQRATQQLQRDKKLTEIGEYTNQLKQDSDARNVLQQKQTDLEKAEKNAKKWGALKDLIGDKSGNKFANFAQGLTLQRLLAFTNIRLTDLSDRYLLAKPKEDGPLRVIDQYQGNTERSVTTLSGGETFLISLALALSLSDMASNNVPLDSLFIDEGFGTLDQETLDVAMDTLERLQSESQKTIGVISHVEALKERIQVQIKLIKNAHGYSRVLIQDS